jgi:hypothetical protein
MDIKNDLQKKKGYSMQEKNTLKNPTLIKAHTDFFLIQSRHTVT